jgi:hypothetical protein
MTERIGDMDVRVSGGHGTNGTNGHCEGNCYARETVSFGWYSVILRPANPLHPPYVGDCIGYSDYPGKTR